MSQASCELLEIGLLKSSIEPVCPNSSLEHPNSLASASLAQVRVARTHRGQKVAVKVQHMHMTDTAGAHYATVELIVNTLHWIFPAFDYRWLIDEVHESLPKELDFLNEANNSIKCMDNFRRLSPHIAEYVYAPAVYWSLSTSKLLTMEFVEGPQDNDLKSIQKLGLNPHDIARLVFPSNNMVRGLFYTIQVTQTFAEMMFKHGFVHCDPHAANLKKKAATSATGPRQFVAVMIMAALTGVPSFLWTTARMGGTM
ncbi:putative ABC1 protein At2g40090 [Bidens hawaiensis]|uniref:putative ABC1 protein At2g40090 n=1 Tax=Bidens hawaiensis TaxID=980011 RepID=UPI00404AC335